jgi:16S rRNA processing protein RimM
VKVIDRTAAEKLTNTPLFIDRTQLPASDDPEEFYLADLIGLQAVRTDGTALGRVAVVHDYGAGASLEIERDGSAPAIVPFTQACVPVVDIEGGRVAVVLPEVVDTAAPGVADAGDGASDRGNGAAGDGDPGAGNHGPDAGDRIVDTGNAGIGGENDRPNAGSRSAVR